MINMLNLQNRTGFKNRHTDGLPTQKTCMKVVNVDMDGEHILLCEWKPFHKQKTAADGYLGTATVIEKQYNGIGFHAWEQNNSEFIYYSLID